MDIKDAVVMITGGGSGLGAASAAEFAARGARIVIVDLPSTLGYIDVPAIANLLDGVILVTEWGRTKIEDLEHIAVRFPRLTDRLIGAFINKDDFSAQ